MPRDASSSLSYHALWVYFLESTSSDWHFKLEHQGIPRTLFTCICNTCTCALIQTVSLLSKHCNKSNGVFSKSVLAALYLAMHLTAVQEAHC